MADAKTRKQRMRERRHGRYTPLARWRRGCGLLVLLCAGLLTACVGPQQLNTLSGYPEVFLPGRSDGPFVMTWIAAQNRAAGLRVLQLTPSRVTVARWAYTSAEARYTYSVSPANRGMNVYLRHDLAQHPGSVDERVSDYTFVGNNARELQHLLETLLKGLPAPQ